MLCCGEEIKYGKEVVFDDRMLAIEDEEYEEGKFNAMRYALMKHFWEYRKV